MAAQTNPKKAPKAPVKPKPFHPPASVLVTGAGGLIGRKLIQTLAGSPGVLKTIVAMDVRDVPAAQRLPGVTYLTGDIRDPDLHRVLSGHKVEVLVHLAAIVNPKGADHAQEEYAVDVLGTENVLKACLKAGVKKFIVTSSGAAYGYHPGNSPLLVESDPLRGNDEFPYARHKRLVEEMLAHYRKRHPELQQLIFRPGTVLGKGTKNQITAVFEGPVVLGLSDAASPFVFIWDEDVAACLALGVQTEKTGVYNLAGDGVMTLKEVAARMHKPFLGVPSQVMTQALGLLKGWGLVPWGPEQVRFLRYRPVLSNESLKREFGYTPRLSSREVFERYLGAG